MSLNSLNPHVFPTLPKGPQHPGLCGSPSAFPSCLCIPSRSVSSERSESLRPFLGMYMAFKILRACRKVSTGSRLHWHHCKEPTSPCIRRVLHCGHLSYLCICMSVSISKLTITLRCLGIIHFMDLGWGRRPPPLWSEKCLYPLFGPLLKLEPRSTPWAPPILVAAHFRIKDEQLITAKRSGDTSTTAEPLHSKP